jgi:hypothetical protein
MLPTHYVSGSHVTFEEKEKTLLSIVNIGDAGYCNVDAECFHWSRTWTLKYSSSSHHLGPTTFTIPSLLIRSHIFLVIYTYFANHSLYRNMDPIHSLEVFVQFFVISSIIPLNKKFPSCFLEHIFLSLSVLLKPFTDLKNFARGLHLHCLNLWRSSTVPALVFSKRFHTSKPVYFPRKVVTIVRNMAGEIINICNL